MNGRAVTQWIGGGDKTHPGIPKCSAGVFHFDGLAVSDWRSQLQVKRVLDPQVVHLKWRVDWPPLEADAGDRNRLPVCGNGERTGRRCLKIPTAINQIPLRNDGRVRLFGIDELQFE